MQPWENSKVETKKIHTWHCVISVCITPTQQTESIWIRFKFTTQIIAGPYGITTGGVRKFPEVYEIELTAAETWPISMRFISGLWGPGPGRIRTASCDPFIFSIICLPESTDGWLHVSAIHQNSVHNWKHLHTLDKGRQQRYRRSWQPFGKDKPCSWAEQHIIRPAAAEVRTYWW